MSHPYGDYADKTSDETHKDYAKRSKVGSKGKALGKARDMICADRSCTNKAHKHSFLR